MQASDASSSADENGLERSIQETKRQHGPSRFSINDFKQDKDSCQKLTVSLMDPNTGQRKTVELPILEAERSETTLLIDMRNLNTRLSWLRAQRLRNNKIIFDLYSGQSEDEIMPACRDRKPLTIKTTAVLESGAQLEAITLSRRLIGLLSKQFQPPFALVEEDLDSRYMTLEITKDHYQEYIEQAHSIGEQCEAEIADKENKDQPAP
jgi:hypothetical protein